LILRKPESSTKISFIDGEKGVLIYRGYRIEQLAQDSSFMEVACLILNGSLPNREELAEFETLVKEARHHPGYSCEILVLIKTKGKTTTDHISPGGRWLRFRGHLTNISKNMLEGAVNAFTGETGTGTNIITGEKDIKIFDLAKFYGENTGGFMIIGDENYGEGSSREHAAMSPRLMGARAVITRSFARIHEANLKKQGILPLTFSDPPDYDQIKEYDRFSILNLAKLQPGKPVKAVIKRKDGTTGEMYMNHTLTKEQIDWFKAGSALNTISDVS